MSYYFPESSCSGGAVPDYTCNPCITPEFGRIRSVALVHSSYRATLEANPSNETLWTTGVDQGKIYAIYKTQGSYDGGTTSELPGFGDNATSNGNTTHILTYRDPNYADNCDFYNAIRSSSEYYLVYRTENYIHFTGAAVTLAPKNPVQDDVNSYVVWEVQAKWVDGDSPCPVTGPATFFDSCVVNG